MSRVEPGRVERAARSVLYFLGRHMCVEDFGRMGASCCGVTLLLLHHRSDQERRVSEGT